MKYEMNGFGLSIITKLGCLCSRETLETNTGRYKILERLGEGGFSTVDLAEHVSTKKLYAIKRIICHSLEDQKVALKEIEYHKKLRHPNIINLVDSSIKGEADIVVNNTAEVIMVLPYYRKGTLHDLLDIRSQSRNHLDVKEILTIFSGICEAVKYLHEFKPEPLAHRDIKTANVCLTDSMEPVLMDLGSVAPAKVQICGSQDAQKLQDTAAERCSMPYKAPELFNVESYCVIDQRTDIWSLGCVLYAMCYFKSPYDIVYERGDSVALAVLSGTINFPEQTPYPTSIHNLISFMLKINYNERPYIHAVIEKLTDVTNEIENKV